MAWEFYPFAQSDFDLDPFLSVKWGHFLFSILKHYLDPCITDIALKVS